MKLQIRDASWHRNGVDGVGFYAILFRDDDDEEGKEMVASLFDEPGYCAVYAVEELVKRNVAFARGNSWRGDRYENELRPFLTTWLAEHQDCRMGPFSIPPADVVEEEIRKHLAK